MDPTKDKKVYTDEERAELAEKLDQDLDSFIAGLERKAYTDGWPEDRWQEVSYLTFFLTHLYLKNKMTMSCYQLTM